MRFRILHGAFSAATAGTYRTKDGADYFSFRLVQKSGYIDVFCPRHPPLRGRDSNVNKTHLWPDGRICFVQGREPKSPHEAISRAKEWAEYFQNYIRTGEHRS